MKRLAVLVASTALVFTACGGDDTSSPPTDPVATTPTTSPTPTTPAELPADLTSAEVCALVDADTVASALNATEVEAAPGDFGTPQCSYNFRAADGSFTNLVTSVQRATDDLDGRVGADAFDYAVELNKMFAGDAEFVDVAGVGDQAVFAQGALALLIAQVGPRVITVAGSSIDQAAATAVGGALASALAAQG